MWRQLTSLGPQHRRWVWALGLIAAAFLLVELLAVWLALRVAKRIVREVNVLSDAADQIAAGNIGYRVPVASNDQLGRLGYAYNRMAASIVQLLEETREKQRLDEEIRVARHVQESLLPDRLPNVERTRVAAAFLPARSVSGDIYDVIQLDTDRIGLLCADVSGKGMPAALLMSKVQAMVRTMVEGRNGNTPSPAALVRRLNQELCRHSPSNTFVTLFWAEYDAPRRKLRWANAGHCPAYLVAGGQEQWLSEGGLPVGMFPSAQYADQERTLPPGSTLVTYTDGVVEAERGDGEAFGENGLASVCRSHAGQGPDQLVRAVVDSVREWTNGRDPGDDLTLVVLQGL
jgi:sigma-B regulation protein RsbU (phosphoserine phosphatase)